MNRPLLIVVTPVRNEAWVLKAFLTHVCSWADYVILADQNSTDGSREIAESFDKTIVINNPLKEMDQAATRYLLFQEVDKIIGDKIVFTLDADEFLSADFNKTDSWKKILGVKENTVFCFKWLNLYGDFNNEIKYEQEYTEWAFYFLKDISIAEQYKKYEVRAVHEMRVPCVPFAKYENIDDIKFIHLARLNLYKTRNKNDFYQVSSVSKLKNRISGVSFFRTYHTTYNIIELDKEVVLQDVERNMDVKELINIGDKGEYYVDEIRNIVEREGIEKFYKLNIWDNPDLAIIKRDIPWYYNLYYFYLRKSQRYRHSFVVRAIDKVLKKIV